MILFFDTETTGLPDKKSNWETDYRSFPHLVQVAWIVSDNRGTEKSREEHIIKPDGYSIPMDASKIHGIGTAKANRKGEPEAGVLGSFIKDAKRCKIVVAQNIYFDTSILKANMLRHGMAKDKICDALHKSKRFDTMRKGMSLLGLKKWPKLGELHKLLFGIAHSGSHTAMGDVEAVMRCYFEIKKRLA